jgi:hypothetical protein
MSLSPLWGLRLPRTSDGGGFPFAIPKAMSPGADSGTAGPNHWVFH